MATLFANGQPVFSTLRNVFERGLPAELQADIRSQLVAMCFSYLEGAGG